MNKMDGKKTYSWLAFLAVTQFPEVSDPLWSALADTGLDPKAVAAIKVVSFILGAVGVAYGRWKAQSK